MHEHDASIPILSILFPLCSFQIIRMSSQSSSIDFTLALFPKRMHHSVGGRATSRITYLSPVHLVRDMCR